MNKKLSNEVLPAPVITDKAEPAPQVRDRVIRKMRLALAAGAATLAMHACSSPPFGVVDPLPPPAHCADMGGPAAQVDVTAGLDVGAPMRRFKITVKQKDGAGLSFDLNATVTGGTVLQQLVTSSDASFTIVPDAGATELVITLLATCNDFRSGNGATTSLLVITVSPVSSDTPTAVVTDVPAPDGGFPDGGDADGGLDGGSDAGFTDGGDGGP